MNKISRSHIRTIAATFVSLYAFTTLAIAQPAPPAFTMSPLPSAVTLSASATMSVANDRMLAWMRAESDNADAAAASNVVVFSIRFCLSKRTCLSLTIRGSRSPDARPELSAPHRRTGRPYGRPTGKSNCRQAAKIVVADHRLIGMLGELVELAGKRRGVEARLDEQIHERPIVPAGVVEPEQAPAVDVARHHLKIRQDEIAE